MLLIDELRRQKYTGVFLRHFMSYAQGMKNYSECGQHLPLYLHKWGSPSGEWKQIALSKIENSLYNKEEKSIAALSGKKILFSNSQILSCLMMIQNLSYPLCKMSKFLIRSFSVISFPLFQLMQQGHANVKGHKLTESGNNNNALGTTTTKKNSVDLQVIVSYCTQRISNICQCVQLLDLLPVIDHPEASAFQSFWSLWNRIGWESCCIF